MRACVRVSVCACLSMCVRVSVNVCACVCQCVRVSVCVAVRGGSAGREERKKVREDEHTRRDERQKTAVHGRVKGTPHQEH